MHEAQTNSFLGKEWDECFTLQFNFAFLPIHVTITHGMVFEQSLSFSDTHCHDHHLLKNVTMTNFDIISKFEEKYSLVCQKKGTCMWSPNIYQLHKVN